MTFKNTLLNFIDELLAQFEFRNKIVYRRLIHIHHLIKNKLDDIELTNICEQWLVIPEITYKIDKRDYKIFKNTPYETDAEWIWEESTSIDKSTIWIWIDALVIELKRCSSINP